MLVCTEPEPDGKSSPLTWSSEKKVRLKPVWEEAVDTELQSSTSSHLCLLELQPQIPVWTQNCCSSGFIFDTTVSDKSKTTVNIKKYMFIIIYYNWLTYHFSIITLLIFGFIFLLPTLNQQSNISGFSLWSGSFIPDVGHWDGNAQGIFFFQIQKEICAVCVHRSQSKRFRIKCPETDDVIVVTVSHTHLITTGQSKAFVQQVEPEPEPDLAMFR